MKSFKKYVQVLKQRRGVVIILSFILLVFVGIFFFKSTQVNQESVFVPQGYTLDTYVIEEVLETSCQSDSECETPSSYLIQSRCPFTSQCLENRCTVVCPQVIE
jgi:hypothetical protein